MGFPSPAQAPSRVVDVARVAEFLKWQGIATLAWAALCSAAGGYSAYLMLPGRGGGNDPAVLAVYAALGTISWITGALQVVASGRMRAFRNRDVCLVALWASVPSFFCGGNICCLPTGIALVVYGMAVLTERSVVEAFERAKYSPPVR